MVALVWLFIIYLCVLCNIFTVDLHMHVYMNSPVQIMYMYGPNTWFPRGLKKSYFSFCFFKALKTS